MVTLTVQDQLVTVKYLYLLSTCYHGMYCAHEIHIATLEIKKGPFLSVQSMMEAAVYKHNSFTMGHRRGHCVAIPLSQNKKMNPFFH